MAGQRRSQRVSRPTTRYTESDDMDDSDDSQMSIENHPNSIKGAKSHVVKHRRQQREPLQPIGAGLRRSNRMTMQV